MSQETPKTVSSANDLYNDINANIILWSSDNVDFRVFTCVLSLALPVFRDVFTLRSVLEHPSPGPQSLPVILMLETSKTLEALLKLLYPGTAVKLKDFEDAKALIAAVTKCDMSERVMGHLKELIAAHFLKEPYSISLYSIACQYGWQDVAEMAARETLQISDLGRASYYVPELDNLSASAYYRLLQYYYNCGENLRHLDVKDDWFYPRHP
ncbi:hypothetical protein J3A83DRAFT_4092319 [Scleroderma citrinum]